MVDVIIPIFNAFAEVQACVERVLQHSPSDTNIILIDDASTDFRVRAFLGDLSSSGDVRVHVLHNDTNLGFVQTVNRGLALGKNDVVLLNSDTLVPANWLEKLQACAQSQHQVGTVTPFSNNAEICSYPVFCRETLVGDLDLTGLELAMESVDDGTYPQIPTAVGFCMYIRREVIDAIGVFDADRFGHGYGEENDFCMRASALGFSHLLCTSAYVVHRGSRSFQTETQSLKNQNLKALLQLYPNYSEQIARFVAADPIAPYRRRIADKLASEGKDAIGQPMGPGILLITHCYGGGVDKHVMDLVELLRGSARVEVLRPLGLNAIALDDCLGNRRIFDASRWDDLVDTLRTRRYARCHIHHLHGYPIAILKLPQALGTPYDLTLHDFGVFCPQYSLTTAGANYCGEPQPFGCNECLRARPHAWGLSIEDWRERMASLLVQAQRVISPSVFVTEKVMRHFPAIQIDLLPHPPRHEWLVAPQQKVKVLILGGLSRAKGLETVLACAWDAKHRNLPLTFTLLGYPERGLPTSPELPLRITGEYVDAELPALIENERADCVWFPGNTPETYSYTLDVALKCGLPVIASGDQGALTERLAAIATTHQIIDAQTPTAQINDVFFQFSRSSGEALAQPSAVEARAREHYKKRLLAALPLSVLAEVQPVAPVSALSSSPSTPLAVTPSIMSLRSLYEQAVECGHRESRDALRQQLELIETDRALLDALSGKAGKPWYEHIQDLDALVQSMHGQSLQLNEENRQQTKAVETLKREVEQHQASLVQQDEVIFQRDQSIAALETQYRELALSSEHKLRELGESSEHKLRELGESSESKQRELLEAHRIAQQSLSIASEHQLRESTEAAADQQRKLIQYYEQSNSWRVTAPMRATRTFIAPSLNRFSNMVRPIRRGLSRWPIAYSIVREQGFGALAKRIRSRLFPAQPPVVQELQTEHAPIASLSLPTCQATMEKPRVSIVIPVYGQHQFTYNCLLSISLHTRLQDVQIIVIDDCSPEPALEALKQVQGVQWIRNANNLGFVRSCNAAAQQATGDYLVLLNNDVQVTQGWLEALLAVFEIRPDAGLVGARLVYPDGRLQEAGGIVWCDGSAWNWGRDQNPDHPYFRHLRPADYCSGACLAIRRTDWIALGGFDCDYVPAYYEDTDLAFRVRKAGKTVYYQPEALIIHYEGVTSGTDESKGIKRHQTINQSTFFDRWAPTLRSHRPNGLMPWAESNRNAKQHVLIVEACMITPDQDSGSVRMLAIVEILTELGVQVSFVADNLEYRQPSVRQLQQIGIEVWHRPHVQSIDALLEHEGSHYDAIIFCRHYIAVQYLAAARKHAPRAKIWFDTVDLHYLREERLAELQKSDRLRQIAAATRAQELSVIEQSDLTLVVSPVEQSILAQVCPHSRVEILSNIHEPIADTPSFKKRNGLLFIGGFQHPPNVDAVQWFVQEVWPLLIQELPNISLKVVGSKMPDSLLALTRPGIEMLGFVEDIDPLLLSSRVSIAPLRYGAGVKGKVNQAMSFGLPVVATTTAIEGMNLTVEQNVLVGDTPLDFAQAIVRLHNNENLWDVLAHGGKDNVRQTFSRKVARNTLSALLGIA